MKNIIMHLLFLLSISGLSVVGFAQEIRFTFANEQITGTIPKFFEFDIMVASNVDTTHIGSTDIYINYNTAGFGSNILNNNKLDLDHGLLFTAHTPPAQSFYIIQPDDFSPDTLRIQVNYSFGGIQIFSPGLPTDPVQMLHVIIEIADETQTSGISFGSELMQGKQFQFDNATPYDTVIANATLDVPLPVKLTGFTAAVEGNKVVLKWVTQSEINNLGFEVYRSAQQEGEYTLIASYENNQTLQGAGNSNTPREYTYEDFSIIRGETYWYQIADVDYQGIRTFHGPVSVEYPDVIPEAYVLHPNYPNPFNPETNILFEIPASPPNSKVKLVIYNSLGTEIRTLIDGIVEPGTHTKKWNGRNNDGERMASGIYFLRLQAGNFSQTRKMLLVQ